MKRPAFQFYPADWRKDLELQSCSIGARGLWVELMSVMHEAEPYGCLLLNGKPMTDAQAATACRVPLGVYRKLLDELKIAGVPGQSAEGVIFSRRMVRDETVRTARAAGGEAGAEHGAKGAVHGSKGGRPRKETGDKKPPLQDPIKPPPSSSSSTASSSSERDEDHVELTLDPSPGNRVNGHDKTRVLRAEAVQLLGFLNEQTGRSYEPVPENIDRIVARLKGGTSADDVRSVIAMKCREWGKDEKMAKYLRPKTLFAAENFANYKGELANV